LQAEIILNQEIVTSATQTGFFANIETMRPMHMPGELKTIYQYALDNTSNPSMT